MGKRKDFGLLHNVFSKCDRDFSIVFRRTPLHSKFMSPANQLSSPRKVNFSGAFQWFCIGSSPWPHLWSFSRMTITDYFIKERSDQKLSAILSCGRQFVVSYIVYVLRNWQAQSFLSARRQSRFSTQGSPNSTQWFKNILCHSLNRDQALFSFRFENYIPAGMAKQKEFD